MRRDTGSAGAEQDVGDHDIAVLTEAKPAALVLGAGLHGRETRRRHAHAQPLRLAGIDVREAALLEAQVQTQALTRGQRGLELGQAVQQLTGELLEPLLIAGGQRERLVEARAGAGGGELAAAPALLAGGRVVLTPQRDW